MTRSPGFLCVLLLSFFGAAAFAQGLPPAGQGGPIPGGIAQPGGAPRPGLPVRDRATPAAPSTGTALMRGRILAPDGSPLRRAQVNLTATAEGSTGPLPRRGATTDEQGRWEVTDLPAARYMVSASKGGYVTVQYGQRRPFEPGTQVNVADAQKVEKIDITLPKGAVIAGRITDEFGEPVSGISVQAMRYTYTSEGQRRLTAASGAPTDDLGQFRVFGLMPGDYVVQAAGGAILIGIGTPGPPSDSFAATFYPGTANSDEAQTVTVGIGQEMNVQFQVTAMRTSRVTGVVIGSDGMPLPGMSLSLVTQIGATGVSSMTAGSTAGDGTFTLTNVSPGEHRITVRPARLGVEGEFASYSFTAAGEPLNVRIVTTKGATLSGRVLWEGNSSHGTTPARVSVQQASQSLPFLGSGSVTGADGTLNDDNSFKLAGANGKGFIRVAPTPPGWTVKSITVDGEDVTDVPIDLTTRAAVDDISIVLTDKLTDLTGHVNDSRGTLAKDYVAVLLPAGLKAGVSPQRFIRTVRPDQDGYFHVKGLPPGNYTVVALDWIEQGRQFVPSFQEELRKAGRPLTLREGQSTTLELALTTGL